jgi:hypothetical protein
VPVFLEKFVLPLFATTVVLLAWTNPMGFDTTQRVTGALALIFAAYFVGHTVYKSTSKSPAAVAPPSSAPSKQPTDDSRRAVEPTKHAAKPQRPHGVPAPKSPLASFTDGQRFSLKQNLGKLAGNNVRIIKTASTPESVTIYDQLLDVFGTWHIEPAEVGSVIVGGAMNYPGVSYLTGPDMSSSLLRSVYSIFDSVGVDLRLTPDAYMGPASLGAPPPVVIVVR